MSRLKGGPVESKEPGAGGGNGADWIPRNKTKAFKALFNIMREKIGNYEKTRMYIGLSCGTLDNLQKGKITAATGRRIFDAYKLLTETGGNI